MKSKTTWILIADGGQAKVFEHGNSGEGLTAITDFMLEEEHLRNQDIMADRPGRSFSSVGHGRSAYEPETDPVQAREAQFMKRVAERLDQRFQHGDFQRLVIAAAPTALGDLRPQLSKALQGVVIAELPKDLTNLPTGKLESHFEDVLAL
jgi:protein required for attachment to host cells